MAYVAKACTIMDSETAVRHKAARFHQQQGHHWYHLRRHCFIHSRLAAIQYRHKVPRCKDCIMVAEGVCKGAEQATGVVLPNWRASRQRQIPAMRALVTWLLACLLS